MPQRVDPHRHPPKGLILLINGGSSSLKAAIATFSQPPRIIHRQTIELSSADVTHLQRTTKYGIPHLPRREKKRLQTGIIRLLHDVGSEKQSIRAVGHRIVLAGPKLDRHQMITARVRRQLGDMVEFDTQHLPMELTLVDVCADLFPEAPQIACFDSVFHQPMPMASRVLPIPWPYFLHGVRRYGFHGLSYASLLRQLREWDAKAARGRVIMAHLGSGCSVAAVRGGKSVATTMGFTPLAGVTMGHRTGDIDPGVILFLMKSEKLSVDEMEAWMNVHCGLAGIAGSGDMKTLLARRDPRAKLAVELFCRRIAAQIAAYTVEIGGLDALVFSGGIGEHASVIRRDIVGRLRHFGLQLDAGANRRNELRISRRGIKPTAWCLHTDEEQEMGRITVDLLNARSLKWQS